GKGFSDIYNLAGGIRDWKSPVAVGTPDQGLDLFDGSEGLEETLLIGFALEQGLREFYLSMSSEVEQDDVAKLFSTLAEVEVRHQEQLLNQYQKMTGKSISNEEFISQIVQPEMEGGMSTDEYLSRYRPDLSSVLDVLSLALSIEAQALDLYQRAAGNATDKSITELLFKIAEEERTHIDRLAAMINSLH
ncbi:MAG: ferritin family protein, partial [Desulfobacterales bacterium]|nr:ferritin family protein [Desulfobacterales bacterium]